MVVPTETDTTTEQHEEIQYARLTYPNLTEFLEEIQNMVMPFFNWREDSSEDDISECPYPPEPPVSSTTHAPYS